MTSSLHINNLIIEAIHGVHQHEKEQPQQFIVSATVFVDISLAGVSDDLRDTLDWSQVRETIIDTVQNNSFNLIERLAYEVTNQLLLDERIQRTIVTIDKPEAFKTGTPGIKLDISR